MAPPRRRCAPSLFTYTLPGRSGGLARSRAVGCRLVPRFNAPPRRNSSRLISSGQASMQGVGCMQAGSAAIPLHCAPACAHGPGRPSLPDGRRVYSSHGIYTPPIRPRRRTSCRPFLDLTVNVQRFNSRVAPLHQKVASERVAPGGVRRLRSAIGAKTASRGQRPHHVHTAPPA